MACVEVKTIISHRLNHQLDQTAKDNTVPAPEIHQIYT